MIPTQLCKPHFSIGKTNTGSEHTTSLCKRLANRGQHVDVQILDNEVGADFKNTIVKDWDATYQLVPPNTHRRYVAERDIPTFKEHL